GNRGTRARIGGPCFPLWRGGASRSAGAAALVRRDAQFGMVAFLVTDPEDGTDSAVSAPRARSRRQGRIVRIVAAGDAVVCTHCEVADRALARMRGLLGRRGLE